MSEPERRPHILRRCPVPDCPETFVTSWWVATAAAGMPLPEEVPTEELRVTVQRHITLAHATTPVQYFT